MLATDVAKKAKVEWRPAQGEPHMPGGKLGVEMREYLQRNREGEEEEKKVALSSTTEYSERTQSRLDSLPPSESSAHLPGGVLGDVMRKEREEAKQLAAEHPPPSQQLQYGSLVQLGLEEASSSPPITTTEYVTTEPQQDEDFEIMENYDPRSAGEYHRTFAWHMSIVMVLLGYITTGVAAITLHWRRDGCLLYKLWVLEGLTEGCCSPDFILPVVMDFMNARKVDYPNTQISREAPVGELPYCTNVGSWRASDAKIAHFIAIFFVVITLFARSCAVASFLIGKNRRRDLYPIFVLVSSVCGLLCVVAYSLTWTGRHLTPGPALWFTGLQMIVDAFAYFSTKSSSKLDAQGRQMAKVTQVFDAWHTMPRRVKIVYVYFLVGWLGIVGAFASPWKEEIPYSPRYPECDSVQFYLLYISTCNGTKTSLLWDAKDPTTFVASAIAGVLLLVKLGCQTMGTYYGWRHPTSFPRYGCYGAWVMVTALAVYGGTTTNSNSRFTRYYVATVCYEAIGVILLHLLYIKYHTQLWSKNFNERRKHPELEEVQGGPAERPILVNKAKTRRVKFMGRDFTRGPVKQEVPDGVSSVPDTAGAPPGPFSPSAARLHRQQQQLKLLEEGRAASALRFSSPTTKEPLPPPPPLPPLARIPSTHDPVTGRRVVEIQWDPTVNPLPLAFAGSDRKSKRPRS